MRTYVQRTYKETLVRCVKWDDDNDSQLVEAEFILNGWVDDRQKAEAKARKKFGESVLVKYMVPMTATYRITDDQIRQYGELVSADPPLDEKDIEE